MCGCSHACITGKSQWHHWNYLWQHSPWQESLADLHRWDGGWIDGVTTEGCAKEEIVLAHGEGHRHTHVPSTYNFWKMTFFFFSDLYIYKRNVFLYEEIYDISTQQ